MTLAQLHDAIVARLSRLVAGADVSVTRAADARPDGDGAGAT